MGRHLSCGEDLGPEPLLLVWVFAFAEILVGGRFGEGYVRPSVGFCAAKHQALGPKWLKT